MQAFLYSAAPSATRPWGCLSGRNWSSRDTSQPCTTPACGHSVPLPSRRASLKLCAMTADEVRSREGNSSISPDNGFTRAFESDVSGFSGNAENGDNDTFSNGSFDESLISSDIPESTLNAKPTRMPKPKPPSRAESLERLDQSSQHSGSSRLSRPDRPRQDDGSGATEFKADPDAIYYTKCSKCTAVYEVDPEQLGRGRKVCCDVCSSVWFQRPERLLILDKENQKFFDYPVDKKDEIMAELAEFKRGNRNRRERDSSDRRYGSGDNREGKNTRRGRTGFSVFLGNLSYDITEEDLKAMLRPEFGELKVTIVKDNESGRSKGFAFCDVKSDDEMESVIQFVNGKELHGRNISARAGRKN